MGNSRRNIRNDSISPPTGKRNDSRKHNDSSNYLNRNIDELQWQIEQYDSFDNRDLNQQLNTIANKQSMFSNAAKNTYKLPNQKTIPKSRSRNNQIP